MAKSGFRHRFHDLKYFEAGFFFMFIEIIINLRAAFQKFITIFINWRLFHDLETNQGLQV